jgi:hypothetical protein
MTDFEKKKCNRTQKFSNELRRWKMHEKEWRRASGSAVQQISNFNESCQDGNQIN